MENYQQYLYKFLRKYFVLTDDQIKTSIFIKKELELHDVFIQQNIFKQFELPLEIIDGKISDLIIKISITTTTISLTINKLQINCKPHIIYHYDRQQEYLDKIKQKFTFS